MFFVVRCPECRKYQLTQATKTFKCRFCSKTKTFSLLKIYYSSPDEPIASQKLKELKEKESLDKDKASGEFFSYSP